MLAEGLSVLHGPGRMPLCAGTASPGFTELLFKEPLSGCGPQFCPPTLVGLACGDLLSGLVVETQTLGVGGDDSLRSSLRGQPAVVPRCAGALTNFRPRGWQEYLD